MRASSGADAPYAEIAARIETEFGSARDFEQLLAEMVNAHSGCDLGALHCEKCRNRETQRYFLQRALIDFFAQFRNNEAKAYERFASEIIKPGDCVITFNYDVSLDCQLRRANKWNISDGYGFSFPSNENDSPIKPLKLHGSSNWYGKFHGAISGYGEAGPGANYLFRPVITPNDMDFLGYATHDPLFGNGAGCPPLIVLPVPSKNFYLEFAGAQNKEMSKFFESLWSQAQKALCVSDEIVVCGYSMPDSDEAASRLVFQSINKDARIKVVSGGNSDGVVQRLHDNGFHSVSKIAHQRFEEWVQSECASPYRG
jgi:superoxide dismutase